MTDPDLPDWITGSDEWADLFERSLEQRLVMEIAQRAGLPYSEVRSRWSREDLVRELGWQRYKSRDSFVRCQQCGTTPDETVGEDGKVLEHSRWKLYLTDCPLCSELKAAGETLSEPEKEGGMRWEVRPRGQGDPFRDRPRLDGAG